VIFRNEESGFVQPTSWTPDGKQILTLFFRKDNISQIALVDAASGASRVLKSLNWVYPKRMDISPDGKWIAYDSFGGDKPGPRDIYVLAMDGSRETKVVAAPGEDLFPVWSPDGGELLFASDRSGTMDAWAVRMEEGRAAGEPRVIRRDLKQFLPMGVTSAGSLFYGLRTGTTNIAIQNGAGDVRELPTRTPGRDAAPAYSRDGKRLSYLSRRGAENFGLQARMIVVRELETGVERDLPAKLAHVEAVRWSPDGEWLLASGSDGKGRSGLFRVRVSDGMVRTEAIDETADYHGVPGDWMPDGTVVRGTAGVKALAVSADGEMVARAYEDRVEAGRRKWPLRGVTWLAWKGSDLLAVHNGAVVVLNDQAPAMLPLKKYDGGPMSVAPGGHTIAFGAGGVHSEVWVLEHVFAPLDARH
jgi:dipeptidyl aminopeptidase/acylaminoacyl peptidase